MAYRDLREYLEALEERNDLLKVNAELSPVLEIPEFLRQVMLKNGPAVIFNKVKGHPGWRVAGNLFGSLERIKVSLEVERLEDAGWRLVKDIWRKPPYTLIERVKSVKPLTDLSRYLPRKTGFARFKEIVMEGSDINLYNIPAFKTWPKDGGRYFTFAQTVTVNPETGSASIGVYRLMIKTPRELVIHWQLHKRGRLNYLESREKDKTPVAVVIGGNPAFMLTGVMPVPHPMDKYFFAGALAGRGISLYELPNGIPVPAGAEAVLEGYVDTERTSVEGPFGDHWGYYDKPVHSFPVMRVERIWMREDPIFVGTIVGKPPLEDAWIGKAVERVFLPILRTVIPEIVEVNFPVHGVFQGLMIVSIKKRYPGQGKKVMNALWGLGQTSLTKIIVVVDWDIDPHDINQVIWAVSSNVNPQRDVVVLNDSHTDHLDPSTPIPGYGSKLGLDATRKFREENDWREWPEEVKQDSGVEESVRRLVGELLGR